MKAKKLLLSRIRGWMPKEPKLPSSHGANLHEVSKEEKDRQLFKMGIVADAIIMNIFLGLRFLIDPHNENVEYIVISWTGFVLALISVNFLLYKYSKWKARNQMEKLCQ